MDILIDCSYARLVVVTEESPINVVSTTAEGISDISMDVHPSATPKRDESCSIKRLSAPYSKSIVATLTTTAVIRVCSSLEIVGNPLYVLWVES